MCILHFKVLFEFYRNTQQAFKSWGVKDSWTRYWTVLKYPLKSHGTSLIPWDKRDIATRQPSALFSQFLKASKTWRSDRCLPHINPRLYWYKTHKSLRIDSLSRATYIKCCWTLHYPAYTWNPKRIILKDRVSKKFFFFKLDFIFSFHLF